MLKQLRIDLKRISNPLRAQHSKRFFKTGPGDYGEGDIFLGPSVPECRAIARRYKDLPFSDVTKLLRSRYHEERLIALFILVYKFQAGDSNQKEKIYNFYLKSTKYINNWDLVDSSADKIVGAYLLDQRSDSMRSREAGDRPKKSARVRPFQSPEILLKLAKSPNLWERRIAIISTYKFIKNGQCNTTLQIAKPLLSDKHDLIHKAVGWMLREVGKHCSEKILTEFLNLNYRSMPRTALRYAIEHFPEPKRRQYIDGKI